MENVNTQVVVEKELTEKEMLEVLNKSSEKINTVNNEIAELEKRLKAKMDELSTIQSDNKKIAKKYTTLINKKFGVEKEAKVKSTSTGGAKRGPKPKTEVSATV